MFPMIPRCWRAMMASLLVAALLVVPSTAVVEAASTTFSGQATVVKGTVLGIPVDVVDTGPVAAGGGDLEATLLCYPAGAGCVVSVPDQTAGAVQARALHAAVVAHGDTSRAEASTANVGLNLAGQAISADLLMARAKAQCNGSTASVSGSAEILGLVINGTPIEVTGEVNQTVTLPAPSGGVVILNEQVGSASGGTGDLTVRALHIQIPGPLPGPADDIDVIVAEAHADIVCGQRSCAGPEKVTGGGYVLNNGGKRNFAVAGRQLTAWGHFLFIDHATGDKMKATTVDPMGFDAAGFAVITGLAEVNGVGGHSYIVKVKDNGEPGRADQFMLTTSYARMNQPLTTLAGGNIQFHRPCA